MKKIFTSTLLLLLTASLAFAHAPEFTSYEEATQYIKANYNAEVIHPRSKVIHRAEYYQADGQGFAIIYFASNVDKGYVYEGITAEVWNDFDKSPKKGVFYNKNIKDKHTINLKNDFEEQALTISQLAPNEVE